MPSYYNTNGNKAVIKQFFVDPPPILLGDSGSTTLINGVLQPNLTRNLSQFSDSEPLSHFYNEFASGPYPGYFSGEYRMDLTKSWEGSSAYAVRTEHFLHNDYLNHSEYIRAKYQIYVDPSFEDEDRRVAIMQWHSGSGGSSPTSTIYVYKGQWEMVVRGGGTDSATGTTFFNLGPVTKGVWHEFIVFIIFSNDINVGRKMVWLNGELATLYSPITNEPWIIPTSSNPAGGFYTLFPAKGEIIQERNGASLFNLAGKTSYPDHTTKYLKFGGYISDTSDLFDSSGNYNGNVDAQYLDKRFRFSDIRLVTDDSKDSFGNYTIDDYEAYRQLKHDGSDPTDIPVGGFTGSLSTTEKYTLTLEADPSDYGTVSQYPQGPHEEGSVVQLTASPNLNRVFDGWFDGAQELSKSNPYNYVTEGSAKTITGKFITAPPPPEGGIRFRGRFEN